MPASELHSHHFLHGPPKPGDGRDFLLSSWSCLPWFVHQLCNNFLYLVRFCLFQAGTAWYNSWYAPRGYALTMENPKDRGDWPSMVHWITKSQTWLKGPSTQAHKGSLCRSITMYDWSHVASPAAAWIRFWFQARDRLGSSRESAES